MRTGSRLVMWVCLVGLFMALPSNFGFAGTDSWTAVGPYGGIIQDLAVDPSDRDIVWAASSYSGVFKTVNGGGSWTRLTNGLPDLSDPLQSMESNCILALDSNTILLGGSFGTVTVYKSTDGGASWTASDTGLPYDPHRFARAKTGSPRPIYAATAHGVYVSTDNGDSWSMDSSVLFNSNVVALAVDPSDANIVWAGVSTDSCYLRDTAGNWTKDVSSLLHTHALIMPGSSTVLAGSLTAASRGTLGGTWGWSDMNMVTTGDATELEPMRGGDVHPSDATAILAGSKADIFLSEDSGASWTAIHQEPLNRGFATVKYAPGDATRAYAASGLVDVIDVPTAPGVLRLDDTAGTWSGTWSSQGIDGIGLFDLEQHPADASLLVAGTGYGLYVSTDGGGTWTERNGIDPDNLDAGMVTSVVLHPGDADTIYAYSVSSGIQETTDGGVTWSAVTNLETVNDMVMDPNAAPDLYCATNRYVAKVTPTPFSFTQLDVLGNGEDVQVESIAADPSQAGHFYCGVFWHGVYKTTNGGASWAKAGVNSISASALAVSPHDTNVVYAGAEGELWRSTDAGATWSLAGANLIWGTIQDIALDPQDANALYIATADAGVWASGSGGTAWVRVPGSLPGSVVTTVLADAAVTRKLFTGLTNGGVYQNTLSRLPGPAVAAPNSLLLR